MSWSINFIGKPENVATALNEHSKKLSDQSKVEYDSALPHLVGLVKENFNKNADMLVKVTASGHGYATGEEQIDRYCTATVEGVYGTIV